MHAEEFDFSEDDSDDDLREEQFSFAEDLSDDTKAQLGSVDEPSPPTPSSDFPSISLVEGGEPQPAPVSEQHAEAGAPEPPVQAHGSMHEEPAQSDDVDGDGLSDLQLQGENPTLPYVEPTEPAGDADAAGGPGYHIEGERAAGGGNRPAKGARQISAGEILSGDFEGTINAGDFLGLDTEFTGPPDPMAAVGPLETAYPPSFDDDFDEGSADFDEDPDAFGQPASGVSPAFVPPADPYDSEEDVEEEEGFEDAYDEPKGSPVRLLVVTVVCAVLGAGGVFFAPKIVSGELDVPGLGWVSELFGTPQPTEVAKAPTSSTGSGPVVGPSTPRVEGGPAATEAVGSDPVVDGGTPTEPAPVSDPVASDPTQDDAVTGPPLVSVSDPVAVTVEPGEDPVGAVPDTEIEAPIVSSSSEGAPPSDEKTLDTLIENLVGSQAEGGERTGFPNLNAANIGWISDDRLDMIWRGEEIPEGAVQGPAKTLMPHVGVVRVTMKSDNIFEGRLYAAGQNSVWIEFSSGTIRLSGESISEIERLDVDPREVRSTEATAATGKRVRVRVNGGLIFGRVQKQHGDQVTIKIDTGGTVVVPSESVEPLGARRAVLIHR